MEALVSVILPAYNGASHLGETLCAVISQDYSGWELVCLDDGSCDATPIMLEEHAWVDARMHVVCQQNVGPGMTRNHGLELVRGEYVVFQDSDDLLHPKLFAQLKKLVDEHDVDVAICNFQTCCDDASDMRFIEPVGTYDIYTVDLPKSFAENPAFRGHPWGKLYRRSVIGENRFNDLRSGEDTFFNIDVLAESSCVGILPDPLYIYRQVGQSLTHQANHHAHSIDAGLRTSIHCIELFQDLRITKSAMLALIRRFGTGAIMLHLLLMMDNPALKMVDRRRLFRKAMTAIQDIKIRYPSRDNLFLPKYRWLYRTLRVVPSLSLLWSVCMCRKLAVGLLVKR